MVMMGYERSSWSPRSKMSPTCQHVRNVRIVIRFRENENEYEHAHEHEHESIAKLGTWGARAS